MKKALLVATMAASALVTLSLPGVSTAQPYGREWDHGGRQWDHNGGRPGGFDLARRIDWMQERINRGRDDGSLDRREAWRAQRQLDGIRREDRRLRYQHGGWLSDGDRNALQDRLDALNSQLHWLRHNDERRPW